MEGFDLFVGETFDLVWMITLEVMESIRWNLDKEVGDNLRWLTMIDIFRKMQCVWEPKTWSSLLIFFI